MKLSFPSIKIAFWQLTFRFFLFSSIFNFNIASKVIFWPYISAKTVVPWHANWLKLFVIITIQNKTNIWLMDRANIEYAIPGVIIMDIPGVSDAIFLQGFFLEWHLVPLVSAIKTLLPRRNRNILYKRIHRNQFYRHQDYS